MKSLFLFLFVSAATRLLSQTIENVDFRAVGKTIVVSYDFLHPKADTSINAVLVFIDQQGVSIVPKSISGDIKNVKPGEGKSILWDVLADGISLSGKYKAEVKIILFNSVKIGSQVWMTENLNVSRFRNGDPIYEAKTTEEWINAGKEKRPAWCHFKNDPINTKKYGKLYNWHAVNDPRGLAPEGWCIPTEGDILELLKELGGGKIAKQAMKSNTAWGEYGNGTNQSKLNALPNGIREGERGDFRGGSSLHWWTSSLNAKYPEYPIDLYISNDGYDQPFYISYSDKMNGFSVRCMQMEIANDVNVNSQAKQIGEQLIQRIVPSVKIGTQVWATENLNVDRFRNGDPIPQAKTEEEWQNAGNNQQPAWCYYNNDPKNGESYGKLYNWYAVNDRRGLAPQGWHIPSDAEWTQLTDFLGGETIAGAKMKSTSGWEENGNGTNTSGFNGLPGGYRFFFGTFSNQGGNGCWWSAAEYNTDNAYYRYLNLNNGSLSRNLYSKGGGFSVRCLRD